MPVQMCERSARDFFDRHFDQPWSVSIFKLKTQTALRAAEWHDKEDRAKQSKKLRKKGTRFLLNVFANRDDIHATHQPTSYNSNWFIFSVCVQEADRL